MALNFSAFKNEPAKKPTVKPAVKPGVFGAPVSPVADLIGGSPAMQPTSGATTPGFIPTDPNAPKNDTIRAPFGTNKQTIKVLQSDVFPLSILTWSAKQLADMSARLVELPAKAYFLGKQNKKSIDAGVKSIVQTVKGQVPTGIEKPTTSADVGFNLERLGFDQGKITSTGERLQQAFQAEINNPNSVNYKPKTNMDVWSAGMRAALTTVVPDVVDAIVAGDVATAGATSVLKATKFNPQLENALSELQLQRQFSPEQFKQNFVRIGKELAAKGDKVGMQNLFISSDIVSKAYFSGETAFKLNALGKELQNIARTLTSDISTIGSPVVTRGPLGTPPVGLPGQRPVGGRMEPNIGLRTQKMEPVGYGGVQPVVVNGKQIISGAELPEITKEAAKHATAKAFIDSMADIFDVKNTDVQTALTQVYQNANIKLPELKGLEVTPNAPKTELNMSAFGSGNPSDIKGSRSFQASRNREMDRYMKQLGPDIALPGGFGIPAAERDAAQKRAMETIKALQTGTTLSDPLISEARKYKTAEEFVKAQKSPVYHGTTENFDKFELQNSKNLGPNAIFVSPQKSVADYYAQGIGKSGTSQVKEAYINGGKIFDYKNPEDLSRLFDELSGKTKDEIMDFETSDFVSKQKIYKDIRNGRYDILEKPAVQQAIKDLGYDGFHLRDYTGGPATGIFNPEVLKTKSQLTDIWNKANQKTQKQAVAEQPGTGSWRSKYDATTDPFVKGDILEAIANGKSTPQELSDVLDRLEKIADEIGTKAAEIAYDVSVNPAATQAIKDRALRIREGVMKSMAEEAQILRGTKGLTADDIMKTYPNIKLTKDVAAKDIYGNKVTIPDGEKLTPYELKGNKILLQDGETYIVSKNQFENIKGQSVGGEPKPFAPELQGTEETVKGKDVNKAYDEYNKLVAELTANKQYNPTGRLGINDFKNELSAEDKARFNLAKENSDLARDTGTKYSSYTLPGGENYKEVLIKAPKKKYTMADLKPLEDKGWKFKKISDDIVEPTNPAGALQARATIEYLLDGAKGSDFKSSHWDEPNVIAHIRLNERTFNGKKVTFMEELQSDWARQLRTEQGVVNPFSPSGPRGKMTPNHSLLKNWQELSVKRALKEAVDSGAEYFAWINGEQTSARYNLATKIDDKGVQWMKADTGSKIGKWIKFRAKEGGEYNWFVDKNGVMDNVAGTYGRGNSSIRGKKLDEVLGKGLADKIMASDTGTLSGEGLKFGGEWANNLYDKQVKNIVEDLTGGKVEVLDMGLPVEKVKNEFQITRNRTGYKLTEADLKVGVEITGPNTTSGNKYIITDVLGDGKFKAIRKSRLLDDGVLGAEYDKTPQDYLDLGTFEKRLLKKNGEGQREWIDKQVRGRKEYLNNNSEAFNISTKKSAGQQALKLTPEIKAKIRGEGLKIKTSGNMFGAPKPQPIGSQFSKSTTVANKYWNNVIQKDIDAGKTVHINADFLKYANGNDFAKENHATYSKAAFELYMRALRVVKNPVVKLTAGGPGGGKTEVASRSLAPGFDGIIYDSNMSTIEGADNQVNAAIDAGKKVEIYGVIPNLTTARIHTLVREGDGSHPVLLETFARNHSEAIKVLIDQVKKGRDVYIINPGATSLEDFKQLMPKKATVADLEKVLYTKDEIITKTQHVKLGATNEPTSASSPSSGGIPALRSEARTTAERPATTAGEGGRLLRSGQPRLDDRGGAGKPPIKPPTASGSELPDEFKDFTPEELSAYVDALDEAAVFPDREMELQYRRFLSILKSTRGTKSFELLSTGDVEAIRSYLNKRGVNADRLFNSQEYSDNEVLDLFRSRLEATRADLLYGRGVAQDLELSNTEQILRDKNKFMKRVEKLLARMTKAQKADLDARYRKALRELKRVTPVKTKVVTSEEQLLKERFRNQARGARESFKATLRRIRGRDQQIRAMRRFFQLDEGNVKNALQRKDYKIMSAAEFDEFLNRLYQEGENNRARLEAFSQLQATMLAGEYIHPENLQHVLKLPSIAQMTTDQLKQFDEELSKYTKGDEFLTVRQLETVTNTNLDGIRTIREARERLAKEMGVDITELEKIRVTEGDRWRWDTSLAEKNPFYKLVVETISRNTINAEARIMKAEHEIDRLFSKARKSRGIIPYAKTAIVPTDQAIFDYLEATPEDRVKLSLTMTTDEIRAAEYVQAEYQKMYERLAQYASLEKMGYRKAYVTHIRRTVLEALKDSGPLAAIKEMLTQQKVDEAVMTILNNKTGEILPLEKFFKFSLQRTGGLVPTKNVARAFMAYKKSFEKKLAIDQTIPKIMVYVNALTPREFTPRGLEKDTQLQSFVKELLNTKKGRPAQLIMKPGGKIDGIVKAVVNFTYLHDLAVNIPIGIASQFGEQTMTFIALGAKRFALGKLRARTAKGKAILKKYEGFVGRTPWDGLRDATRGLPEKLYNLAFGLFRDATVRANKDMLLGSMSREEWANGEISAERLSALKLEIGRYRVVEGAGSIIGGTGEGRVLKQYKTWAIAPARTVTKNIGELARMLKSGKNPTGSREFHELFRATLVIALVTLAAMEAGDRINNKKDKSFGTQLMRKAINDAYSVLSAVDPTTLTSVSRAATFVADLGVAFKDLVTLAEYKNGDLKGPKELYRQLTPQVVQSFPDMFMTDNKKTGLSLPSLPALPKINLPTLPRLPSLKR